MAYNKQFFEKVFFSDKRMERYFRLYPQDENRAICWNLDNVTDLHNEFTTLLGWMNKDVPGLMAQPQ